jgi:hypothetical protein
MPVRQLEQQVLLHLRRAAAPGALLNNNIGQMGEFGAFWRGPALTVAQSLALSVTRQGARVIAHFVVLFMFSIVLQRKQFWFDPYRVDTGNGSSI